MTQIAVVGIDLAKNVFQIHGVDPCGKTVVTRKLSRNQVVEYFSRLSPCLIGMEACSSAHYWARRLQAQGHSVKLMPPQYVKPYVKTNKNDMRDAEAICEAVTRPSMRFVPIKDEAQQAILVLHRVRSGIVKQRVALGNQIRGLLGEFGIALPQGESYLRNKLIQLTAEGDQTLPPSLHDLFGSLYRELVALADRIKSLDRQLEAHVRQSDACQRIQQIEGVGVLSATAIVASVGDIHTFKNARQFSFSARA